ncbi:MAG TPA: tetratricopeptide repeat protein [Gemmatimonadaceae bacterium]|jgi:tetratricopeptide (TPR) repeat protein
MATSARIDELRKKFEENPRRYFAPLANEYRKAGDPERAAAICEEYLPQQPGHMSGHIVYGQALYELGRYDEARQVFETALSLDPENLIALRHLGDIARMAGDAHAARVWYQRVLEADPRNEEIAQLMMSLLSTPVGSTTVDHNAPTPLNTPAVPPRASTPAPVAAVEASPTDPQLDTTAEIEAPRAAASQYTPFPPPPVAPQNFVSRHAPKEDELLDLDSFDLGGVPLSSLRTAKSAEAEAEPAAPSPTSETESDAVFEEFDSHVAAHHDTPFATQVPVEDSHVEHVHEDTYVDAQLIEEPEEHELFVEGSFVPAPFVEQSLAATPASPLDAQTHQAPPVDVSDVGIEKAQEYADGFEPDAFAIAAKPLTAGDVGSFEEEPPGTIELASDIDLGLPDDGGSSSTFTTSEEEPVDGLESFEPGFISEHISTEEPEHTLATESFFDTPRNIEASTPDALVDGFVEDSAAVTGSSAFAQVRDETTSSPVADVEHDAIEPLEFESSELESSELESSSPPFPEAASSIFADSHFHEAEPASSQGDPFTAAAFGEVASHEEPFVEDVVQPVEAHEAHEQHEAHEEHAALDAVEPDVFEHQLIDASAESFDDVEEIATPDSTEGDAHVPAAEVSATAQPGAFVTETMATLYLEQGHFDKAIDIYRQLVQQRPDDIPLRDRLHAAEERAWGQHDLGASILDETVGDTDFSPSENEGASHPTTYGGPTIREFLTGLFYRRSMTVVEEMPPGVEEEVHAESPHEKQEQEQEQEHEDVAAMAELPPEHEASSTRINSPASPSDSVGNSLGALFAEADAATHSDHMATPIGGTPAHRAPTELSLDHVFKSNPGQMPNRNAFSFDQFFSEGAVEPSAPAAEPVREAPTDANDDIAQFNKWLNGLKKS